MGRKPKKKDIAEYLWHSEPTKINTTNDNWRIRYGYLDSEGKEHQTTETVNNERAKKQFISYLLLREKEHKAAKGATTASKFDKTEIETVEQLLFIYAEHTKYLHTIGDKYGWDEGTYRANIGKIRNYVVPVFGSFRVWEITRVDMRQGFKDMLQLPGIIRRMEQKYHSALFMIAKKFSAEHLSTLRTTWSLLRKTLCWALL